MLQTTISTPNIDYRESENFTNLGGFLMVSSIRRRVTMSARLTDEEKQRGLLHLLDQLNAAGGKVGVYLWMNDAL